MRPAEPSGYERFTEAVQKTSEGIRRLTGRDEEIEDDRGASGWEALFGPGATAPQNRAERRAREKELASRIRRNQRAHARRTKKEAGDGG